MPYTPVEFTKGSLTEVAETPEQYAQLTWEGWIPTGSPQPTERARSLIFWRANESLTAGSVRVAPTGQTIVRNANGVTRSTYDSTEQAAWTTVAGGSGGGGGDATLAGTQTFTGNKTFSGGLTSTSLTNPMRSTTWFGLGAGIGNARTPFYQNSVVDPVNFNNEVGVGGADDYVGQQTNVMFQTAGGVSYADLIYARTGNMTSGSATLTLTSGTFALPIKVGYTVFVPGAGPAGATLKTTIATIVNNTTATLNAAASTTITGSAVEASLVPDPRFLFGANDYIQTKNATNALAGITDVYGRLTEIHVWTPNSTLTNVKGLQIDHHVEPSAAGSTVTNLYGILIKAGRTAGSTVTNSYGLFVQSQTGVNPWAIYTDGASPSRFGGNVTIANANLNAGTGTISARNGVFGLPNAAVSGRLCVYAENAGNDVMTVRGYTAQTAELLRFQTTTDNTNWTTAFAVTAAGIPRWTAAANQQTTVGAAGGASALPATPAKYLKVVDSAGTVLVIPAYTA